MDSNRLPAQENLPLPATATGETAGLRHSLEELSASALSVRAFVAPLFAAIAALIALRWADHVLLVQWFLFVSLYPALQRIWRTRFIVTLSHAQNAARMRLLSIAMELPMHLAWALYVPMCWKSGQDANNAFLLLYLMGCAVATVRIYGPCIHHLIASMAVYMPFVVLHRLNSGDTLTDTLLTVIQIVFFIYLALLARHHYYLYRHTSDQLDAISAQMRRLAIARDEAERASAAKSNFLAGMSHELRTPLNAIIGFSDMMRQGVLGPVMPSKYSEYAEDIFTSGQHLLGLINDVLDLSKIEAGRRELTDSAVNIGDMLSNVVLLVHPQAQSAGVQIETDSPAHLIILADERAIRQILFNFLSNAIKFSQKDETITAFARPGTAGGWRLGVSDHGIGMDEPGIRKALEPYGQVSGAYAVGAPVEETANGQGTGLGLPIAKALIEAHGAHFHIESAPGIGTTVWGEFPAHRIQVAK